MRRVSDHTLLVATPRCWEGTGAGVCGTRTEYHVTLTKTVTAGLRGTKPVPPLCSNIFGDTGPAVCVQVASEHPSTSGILLRGGDHAHRAGGRSKGRRLRHILCHYRPWRMVADSQLSTRNISSGFAVESEQADQWLTTPSGESCARLPEKGLPSRCDLAVGNGYRTIRAPDICASSNTRNRRV